MCNTETSLATPHEMLGKKLEAHLPQSWFALSSISAFPADSGLRMTEEEHEMRSVFVSQLSARVGDRELFQFCEANVGKVRDARVILDRVSRRSKG